MSVAPGEYLMDEPLRLGPADGGTDSSQVIYQGQPGGRAVFYGGTFLPPFEKVNDRLWRCLIPDVRDKGARFEQLYVNGKRARQAGFLNTGFFTPQKVTELLAVHLNGRYKRSACGLDTAGEWFLENSGYLYYVPRAGETNALPDVHFYCPVPTLIFFFSNSQKNIYLRFQQPVDKRWYETF